jgi:uncharacterized membrane protein
VIGVIAGGPIAVAALGASLGGLLGVADLGISNDMMETLGDGLGQDDSAIALLVKKANWEVVRDRTDKFGGRILISNLTDETLEALEKLAAREDVAQAVTEEVVEGE